MSEASRRSRVTITLGRSGQVRFLLLRGYFVPLVVSCVANFVVQGLC